MTYEAWSADAAASVLQEFTSDSTKVLVALQELQQRFGFVHDEDLDVVARTCNVSRAEVYGVLTFYHELRTSPPGSRVVRVCRAEACQAVGAIDIERAFAAAGHPVGSHTTTVDVEAVYCFGNCALGPAVEIDGTLHGRCTPTIVTEALR